MNTDKAYKEFLVEYLNYMRNLLKSSKIPQEHELKSYGIKILEDIAIVVKRAFKKEESLEYCYAAGVCTEAVLNRYRLVQNNKMEEYLLALSIFKKLVLEDSNIRINDTEIENILK